MNYNNMGYGFHGIPQGTGYQYGGAPMQMPTKINNVLTQEEIQRLMQKENQFSLQITETERLKASCNHRSVDGFHDAIVDDPERPGRFKCTICGYKFNPLDTQVSKEELEDYVTNILDVLHTIKLLYIDMPDDVAKEYYMIIPLIERIPELFSRAVSDHLKHTNYGGFDRYNNRNMSTMSLYNMLVGSLSGGMPGYGMPQQQPMGGMGMPNYSMPQQQPMGMAPGFQPQVDPNGYAMGQQPMPGYGMSNGFGYNGAAMNNGYMPQTGGFQYNPGMAQQPMGMAPAPVSTQPTEVVPTTPAAAPVDTKATTDGKDVKVKASFKA